ncbi:non-ribosomal peptide synthetase [Streptomyces silvisoli]|uniref:Amino acid adenylation domain-containing protein n=1 Tax=Streptomyces silvisoli TaxID=3034235 RepID=A0ABT5ZH91_9ACTN|nr:amino acid adenylation domain-containing protein [Streptomyces silvisoli]MDF3289061.1 amino acid adenylation domain-containing protein [Streptomyces silvisoli]
MAPQRNESIADLLRSALERNPDAVAVRTLDRQLTYRELLGKAGAVAKRLDAVEVPVDEPVGLLLRRTPELIAALLGVLLSGRTYLPLDAGHPADRIAFLLADSGARRVLVDQDCAGSVPPGPWTLIDTDACMANHREGELPFRATVPGATALVIYTSGTTGAPKGCWITHRSLDNFVGWTVHHCPRETFECSVAATSLCFDFSVAEILPALTVGGSVLVLNNHVEVADLPAHVRPTQINGVPSVLSDVMRDRPLPSSVQLVTLGGEAVPPSLVARLLDSGVPLVRNVYGPTETTVVATSTYLTRADTDRTVSLGDPVSGVEIYLVDDAFQQVPDGAVGELVIGGIGVSNGYPRLPALTASRFVADPFSGNPGRRVYRSGDHARRTEDGRLEFVGRRDHQVKIRGVRIELSEIEQVLMSHRLVSAAAVSVAGTEPAQYLLAYIWPADHGTPPTVAELSAHVGAKLPSALRPAHYALLDELPLTTNGKIDRSRLPREPQLLADRDHRSPEVANEEVGLLEGRLAEIWASTLKVQTVRRDDNIYALGGNSMALIRIRKSIGAELGMDVPMQVLLGCPTVAELAAELLDEFPADPDMTRGKVR